MSRTALDLNDAAILAWQDGQVVLCDVGYAALENDGLSFGASAFVAARLRPRAANRRYWRDLADAPMAQPMGTCRSTADLAHAHLLRIVPQLQPGGADVVIVVPAYWDAGQTGLALGLAQDAGLTVSGLVDSAIAASRRPCPARELWHLDLTLHEVILSRIRQNDMATLDQRHRLDGLGVERLDRAAAQCMARAFLKTSRFDALQHAESESALYGRLAEWLAQLRRTESRELALDFGGHTFTAVMPPSELRDVIARTCEPLVQRLRTLVSARTPAVLQIPERLAQFPGALEVLSGLSNWEILVLEPAASARGALRVRAQDASAGLQLLTALPWDQPAVAEAKGTPAREVPRPTHVLYGHQVFRLGETPLQVGLDLPLGEPGLSVPAATTGVSRRHCTLQIEDGQVLVHDHSRYGTTLNGHRVDGSAVLHAGDVLRFGTPAQQLILVRETE